MQVTLIITLGIFLIASSILVLVNIPYASLLISFYIIVSTFLLNYPTFTKGGNQLIFYIILLKN
jgi:hypothetical protein